MSPVDGSRMHITRLKPQELTRDQRDGWSALLRTDPAFASPFFRPEYVTAVGSICPEVEVAVWEGEHGPLGFWPYHRDPRGVARPVGLSLSDLQGVVAKPDLDWTAAEVLAACGLSAWTFDHQVAS